MLVHPPVQIDRQILHPRPKPHICNPPYWQQHMRPQGVRRIPFRREFRESRIDLRRKTLAAVVVVIRQRRSLRVLLRRIECPRRQLRDIKRVARNVPVHLVGRNKIQGPRLYPADPARLRRFPGIRCIARRQWFDHAEHAPVTPRPRSKRRHRQQHAHSNHLHQTAGDSYALLAPNQCHDERRCKRQRHQCTIRPQQCCIRHRKRKPESCRPSRPFLKFRRAPHRQRNHKQRRPLRQGIRRVHCRKGTQRCQPQCGMRRPSAQPRRRHTPREISQQQATHQVQTQSVPTLPMRSSPSRTA